MKIFTNLPEALRAGYHVFERTPDGYLVRIRLEHGFALALVVLAAQEILA